MSHKNFFRKTTHSNAAGSKAEQPTAQHTISVRVSSSKPQQKLHKKQ